MSASAASAEAAAKAADDAYTTAESAAYAAADASFADLFNPELIDASFTAAAAAAVAYDNA